MRKAQPTKYFSLVIGMLPLIVELIVHLTGSISDFPTFISLGVIALAVLVWTLVNSEGLSLLNQWTIEKIVSLMVAVIFGILAIEKIFVVPNASGTFMVVFLSLVLPLVFYDLVQHFNAKNIVTLFLAFISMWLLAYSGSWLILVVNSVFATIYYFFNTRIVQENSFRLGVALTLAASFVGSLALSPVLYGTLYLVPSKLALINLVIALFMMIAAFSISRVIGEVVMNGSVFGGLFLLLLNYYLILQTVNLYFIDLLGIIILTILTFGLILGFGGKSPKLAKLSVIVPTYNGADTIVETFDSIRRQSYRNIEVVVMDDGSGDNTTEVVESYQKAYPKFDLHYYQQANADQLNAIKNALQYITGDAVYILHSDDLFYNQNVVENGLNKLNRTGVDGVFIDLVQIDAADKVLKNVYTKPFYRSRTNLAKLALTFGRNPYVDFAFWQRETFEDVVYQSYLTNNMVAWFDFDKFASLKMQNGNFFGIKYRVHEGNYLNSADGSVNVLSGELRILTHLLSHLKIPQFKMQSTIYRAFNKFKFGSLVPVVNFAGQTDPSTIVNGTISRRLDDFNHPYIKAISGFFEAQATTNREIKLSLPGNLIIYHGSDIRLFNRDLAKLELNQFYLDLMSEMEQGFSKVTVSQMDLEKMNEILEFFCIHDYVEVDV